MSKKFHYELRQSVALKNTGEAGSVRARAEWATGNLSYLVAYKSATGCHIEQWVDEELLGPVAE